MKLLMIRVHVRTYRFRMISLSIIIRNMGSVWMFDVITGKFNVTYSGCLIVKIMLIFTNRGDL
jgi:hypothetical protein